MWIRRPNGMARWLLDFVQAAGVGQISPVVGEVPIMMGGSAACNDFRWAFLREEVGSRCKVDQRSLHLMREDKQTNKSGWAV